MGTLASARLPAKLFLKRRIWLKTKGFEVVHGIVDSLWLKKPDATMEDYRRLCDIITTRDWDSNQF